MGWPAATAPTLTSHAVHAVRAEFTPGKSKGIDYMFGGEQRRLKKTVAQPSSNPEQREYSPVAMLIVVSITNQQLVLLQVQSADCGACCMGCSKLRRTSHAACMYVACIACCAADWRRGCLTRCMPLWQFMMPELVTTEWQTGMIKRHQPHTAMPLTRCMNNTIATLCTRLAPNLQQPALMAPAACVLR